MVLFCRALPRKPSREHCDGFVYRTRAGEQATFVRMIRHSDHADPENVVASCQQCRQLYEITVQKGAMSA